MTQTGSSNAIVNAMLGWLKGLASWVLRLFNLSGGFSPLKFLANNWLKLLVLLLLVGVTADLLIWLIRWRPHWVWFHKKRVIINDKNFFAGENEEDEVDEAENWALPEAYRERRRRSQSRRDWQDNDYVVTGAARRRREEAKRQRELAERARSKAAASAAQEVPAPAGDVFTDGQFNVNAKQKFSDRYEDEVFSVSNLPRMQSSGRGSARQRERGGRDAHRAPAKKAAPRAGEGAARRGEVRPEARKRVNEGKR